MRIYAEKGLGQRTELPARGAADFDAPEPVRFYDTTLRDGEQTVGVVSDAAAKAGDCAKLDDLGVGRIEAGFPRVSAEDREAISADPPSRAEERKFGALRARYTRTCEELIRLGAATTVIEMPTSDIKLKRTGLSVEEAMRRAAEAVGYANQNGIRVAFFPVDGTRADLNSCATLFRCALDAGAQEFVRGRHHWRVRTRKPLSFWCAGARLGRR